MNSPTSFTLDLTQVDYQVPDLLAGKDGMIVNPAAFRRSGASPPSRRARDRSRSPAYVPDSHASLVRNPNYWDASQIHIQNFNVLDITQPEQILSALESGQVNVAYIAGNQVAAAKAAGFKIDVIPSEVVDELDLQTTTAPFNNPDVVKALNYAIDRQAILQVQASGYGAVAYQPFPAGVRRLQLEACQRVPVQPDPGQAAAGAGRVLEGPEDHPDRAERRRLGRRADPGPARAGRHHRHDRQHLRDTETQYLYLDKTIPFAVDGTAGRMSPVEMLDVLYSQQGLMNVDGKATTTPAAVTSALSNVLTVPLTSPDYPTALQNAVATAVQDEPTHIWLYTNPRIFAYSPSVTGIPSDLVQQRWEGVRVGELTRWQS